jgi:hypothetical protein
MTLNHPGMISGFRSSYRGLGDEFFHITSPRSIFFACCPRRRIRRLAVVYVFRQVVLAFGCRIKLSEVLLAKLFRMGVCPALLRLGYERHVYFPALSFLVASTFVYSSMCFK